MTATVTRIPVAYRPRDLGPNQRRYMQDQGWVDRRIIQRTKVHKPWCHETCSAFVCTCQTEEKPK